MAINQKLGPDAMKLWPQWKTRNMHQTMATTSYAGENEAWQSIRSLVPMQLNCGHNAKHATCTRQWHAGQKRAHRTE